VRELVAVLLLAMSGLTYAGDVWLTVPIASYHFDREREGGKGSYEQTNPGLGLEYVLNDRWRLGAGMYRSSIRTDAGYVGAVYLPLYLHSANLRVGSAFGVVSGYEGNLLPLLVPTAVFEWKSFGINVLFVPPTSKAQTGGVGLQLKFRLP